MTATTTTTAAAAPPTGTGSRRPRLAAVPGAVWALSVLAAAVAVALALTAFRHGSVDNDDAVYLLQARLIAHGHLTGAMPLNPEAQQPWFFAITSHGYVPKYLPVVALLYAVGLVLFGSVVPVLGGLAFVLPLAVHGLARTAGLDRRRAVAATAIVALSPAVLVQGGLVLSYLPFLVLLVLGWTLLLVVWRSANPWAAGGFGLVAATAACFRPFDPVVLLGPAALFVLWRLWRQAPRAVVRPVTAAVAGAVPVAVLLGVYDRHVTGSPLHLPFNLLSPSDSYGYGTRKLVPEDPPWHFGPLQGLHGFWLHFLATPAGWVLGFVLVLPLAAWNLRRGGAAPAQVRLVAASAAVFAVSYLAFWGPWNTSVLWGGPNTVGPFYAIPTIVPIALAAASWWPTPSRRRAFRLATAVGVGALVGNVWTVHFAVEHNWSAAQRTGQVLHAVRDAPGTLLLDVDPPYLAHPVGAVGDEPLGDGRTLLLASQLSADQVTSVSDPTLLQVSGGVYGVGGLSMRTVQEQRTSGTALALHVVDDAAVYDRSVLVVSRGGRQQACAFGGAVDLTVTTDAISGCSGWAITGKLAKLVRERPYRSCATSDCVAYTVYRLFGATGVAETTWRTTPVAVSGDTMTTLTDGRVLTARGSGWLVVSARS